MTFLPAPQRPRITSHSNGRDLCINIVNDMSVLCSHCGRPEDGSIIADAADCILPGDEIGLPVCCDAAQAEYRASKES